MFDYLVVGAGLFGSVFAYEASKRGKKCLVIDKRSHIGGNCFTKSVFADKLISTQEISSILNENLAKNSQNCVNLRANSQKNSHILKTNPKSQDNLQNSSKTPINVHIYGAHIFHTSNAKIWDYIRHFADFNHFINSPLANYKGKIYNLPFNMNTFAQLFNGGGGGKSAHKNPSIKFLSPQQAECIINSQKATISQTPRNLEEQAISLVGTDIYEKLIKGYTQKQWGKPCKDLPASIIRRLPVRFTYDNNYFNDCFQGIAKGGYTGIFAKMLQNCEVWLNTDFLKNRNELSRLAKKIIYTGTVDGFFDYEFGKLEYRSLRFEHEILACENYQGVAVMNFTDAQTPYTRIIEHKHFEFGRQDFTIISREFPQDFSPKDNSKEPYYPINDTKNTALYEKYTTKARLNKGVIFGGRLGEYRYYDMDKTIEKALVLVKNEFGE